MLVFIERPLQPMRVLGRQNDEERVTQAATKVIGYFAYLSPTRVVCTDVDACVVSGSGRAMASQLPPLSLTSRVTRAGGSSRCALPRDDVPPCSPALEGSDPDARWRRRVVSLVAGLLTVIAPVLSAAATPEVAREVCEVPGHGGLGLEVPSAWRASCRPLAKPASASASFRPLAGNAFDLRVTAVWVEPAHRDALADAALRSSLERVAVGSLPQAIEATPVFEEVRGAEAFGYVFSLTDKAPGPGEFKYLTQGNLRVGELQVIFTLLSGDEGAAEKGLALTMFRGASHVSKR